MDHTTEQTTEQSTETSVAEKPRHLDWLHVTLLVLVAVLLTAGFTFWLVKTYVFPSEFTPVYLNAREEQVLETKLERLESVQVAQPSGAGAGEAESGVAVGPNGLPTGPLEPEPYSEEGVSREIVLTEKELNALLARNTDLARRLAIDLSGDLVSAKLLVPVDEDFPFIGGQIMRVRAGAELAFREGRPVVVLKGISIWGVPLPNAWIGGIKNIDLIKEYGAEEGFWKAFADGVDHVQVGDGELRIRLKE